MEIWKALDRLPGYEVSSTGKVRSSKLGLPKLLSVVENNVGYKLVCLYNNKKRINGYIHRLVAEAFIPTNLNIHLAHVNHIDKNTRNNNIDNLEWVHPIENMLHSTNAERYFLYQRLKIAVDNMTDENLKLLLETIENTQ
jgi:hypothetical protein